MRGRCGQFPCLPSDNDLWLSFEVGEKRHSVKLHSNASCALSLSSDCMWCALTCLKTLWLFKRMLSCRVQPQNAHVLAFPTKMHKFMWRALLVDLSSRIISLNTRANVRDRFLSKGVSMMPLLSHLKLVKVQRLGRFNLKPWCSDNQFSCTLQISKTCANWILN